MFRNWWPGPASRSSFLRRKNQSGRFATSPWAREQSMAVFSMGVALGSLIGPFIGGFVAQYLGYDWAFLILALPALFSTGFVIPLMAQDKTYSAGQPASTHSASFGNPRRIFGYHRYMFRAFLVSSLILMGKDMFVA